METRLQKKITELKAGGEVLHTCRGREMKVRGLRSCLFPAESCRRPVKPPEASLCQSGLAVSGNHVEPEFTGRKKGDCRRFQKEKEGGSWQSSALQTPPGGSVWSAWAAPRWWGEDRLAGLG